MRRWLSKIDDVALVVIIAVGGWWGYRELRPSHHTAVSTVSSPAHLASSARDALDRLAVKGRAPKTGYARSEFGDGWVDVDRNGCDTRNDMLRRDLTDVTIKEGTYGCVVLSGTRDDPYTGRRIPFVKGNATSTAIQIDHVVALSDAWQKGAQGWDAETRIRFANDPLNLLAVSQAANQAKSDGDAATWLPSNKAFRCDYVARQIAVKAAYGLWVTAAEKAAMAHVLAGCPTLRVPTP